MESGGHLSGTLTKMEKGAAQSSWIVEAPQAVGEVGRQLHPNLEVGGQVSRLLAEVFGDGIGGSKVYCLS